MSRKLVSRAGAVSLEPVMRRRLGFVSRSLAWSPDGARIGVTGEGENVIVPLGPRRRFEFAAPGLWDEVDGMAWKPSGAGLALWGKFGLHLAADEASIPESVRLWNRVCLGASFSPDGRTLAAIFKDVELRGFACASGGSEFRLPGAFVGRPVWSPDGKRVVALRREDEIDPIHDVHETGTYAIVKELDQAVVFALRKTDGALMPSWSVDGSLLLGRERVEGVGTYEARATAPLNPPAECRHVVDIAWSAVGWWAVRKAYGPNGPGIVCGHAEVRGEARRRVLGSVIDLAWSPSGDMLATVERAHGGDVLTVRRALVDGAPRAIEIDPRYADGHPPVD